MVISCNYRTIVANSDSGNNLIKVSDLLATRDECGKDGTVNVIGFFHYREHQKLLKNTSHLCDLLITFRG